MTMRYYFIFLKLCINNLKQYFIFTNFGEFCAEFGA